MFILLVCVGTVGDNKLCNAQPTQPPAINQV